jgi:co-chaperonin GroES (HSP10)
MTTFKPFYDKIEVEPINKKSLIAVDTQQAPEKGKVISVGRNVEFVKPGDIIFFNAWGCSKTADGHYIITETSEVILGKEDD